MSNDEQLSVLRELKRTHERFTVGIGVTIGIIFLAYFFSFAQFVDRLADGVVIFQVISSIGLVLCLIFIKKVALFFTRLRYSKNAIYSQLLRYIQSEDFDHNEDGFSQRIYERIQQHNP